jgi:thiamine pyrophosphate-dependent acetolactate synthase large subunit-like protein
MGRCFVTRAEVVRAVAEFRDGAVVVMGPGKSCPLMWQANHRPASIYNMELAYASPVALGIALSGPTQRVISLEGDGSMFAGIPSLGTIARKAPPNLTVIVLANGIWGTSDGTVEVSVQPSNFPELARGCGWDPAKVRFASDIQSLRAALEGTLTSPGPWFLVAEAERSSEDASVRDGGVLRVRERPPVDIVESVDSTRRWLRARVGHSA